MPPFDYTGVSADVLFQALPKGSCWNPGKWLFRSKPLWSLPPSWHYGDQKMIHRSIFPYSSRFHLKHFTCLSFSPFFFSFSPSHYTKSLVHCVQSAVATLRFNTQVRFPWCPDQGWSMSQPWRQAGSNAYAWDPTNCKKSLRLTSMKMSRKILPLSFSLVMSSWSSSSIVQSYPKSGNNCTLYLVKQEGKSRSNIALT